MAVDLEVDKRVKIIGEHIEFNIRKAISEEYQLIVKGLNKELEEMAEKHKKLQR